MTLEDELVAARARRTAAAERVRAEAQVDAEVAASRKLATGEAILRIAAGKNTSQTFAEARPTKKTTEPARPAVDPAADPLETLSPAERAELEADPKRIERFKARVAAAESKLNEEQEIAKNRAEAEAAWAANERADAAADRVIAERAKARGQ